MTTTDPPTTDSPTPVDTTVIDAYLATWNERDAAKRAELIDASIGTDLWYRDPMLEADGREAYEAMIVNVQAQLPDHVMRRTSEVDAHRDVVRFNWALGAEGAEPTFAGLDVAKYDADGRLHRIIGFAGETVPGSAA